MPHFFSAGLAWVCAGLALAVAPVHPALAQAFELQPSSSTGYLGQPHGLAVADINADGNLDALVANTYSSTICVQLGNGAGRFTPQVNLPSTGPNTQPYCVAVADVNSDGRPDVLTANSGTSTLSVLLGNGAGGFALQPSSPSTGSGSQPLALVLADVNGDGQPDALTANIGTGTVSVLLGDGAGGFALQPNSPATGPGNSLPRSLAVADVDGDGKPDVLAANSDDSSTLAVLLGNGAGGFALAGATRTGNFPTNPYGLAIGDVNNDGKPDALTANISTSTVSVLLGNGLGSFTLQGNSPYSSSYYGGQPTSLALADINGDGQLDALVVNSNYGNNTVGILLGDGAGGFAVQDKSPSVGAYTTPFCVVAADVTSDGKPDLLVPSVAYSTLNVLFNTTEYPAPTLRSVGPSPAAVGSILTLTGTGLAAVRQVNFTGATQTTLASRAATYLRVVVPAGARSGPVSLTTPGGTSNSLPLTSVLATQAAPPAPPQAVLYPNPAEAGLAPVLLVVSGLPPTTTHLNATLLDVLGQPVSQLMLPAGPGPLRAAVPTAGLARGVYVLRVRVLTGQGQVLGLLPAQRLSVR